MKKKPRSEPRFFADCMLGRLARWMRAVGLDTLYEHNIDDDDLLRKCRTDKRFLLTRDTALVERCKRVEVLYIESENTVKQLRQILGHFGLDLREEHLFTRCTYCNRPIEEVPREKVKGQVPPYVYRTEKRFNYCPNCDKLFWRGTHRDRFLKQVFPKGIK